MARKRMLSPQWAKHADLYDAEVSSGLPLRVAFAALWTVTDRRGVFAWSRNLKPDVLPYDHCDMLAVLEALAAGGFVVKYIVDGKPYGFIPSFTEHQHFHKDEKPSTLPAPPEHRDSTGQAPGSRVGSTAPDGLVATSDIRLADTASDEEAASSSSPDVENLLNGLPTLAVVFSWRAEINAARQGMHGPPLTDEQIDRACREYVGNGHLAKPTLRHFRGFLAKSGRGEPPPLSIVPDDDAWSSALEIVGQLTRSQIDAAAFAQLDPRVRAGFKAVGGWTALRDLKPDSLPHRKREYLAAYARTPAQAGVA